MQTARRILTLFLILLILMPAAAAEPHCSDWFFSELSASAEVGLLPDSFSDADLTCPILREEVCELLVSFWTAQKKALPQISSSPFTDTSDEQILQCHALGLISGYGDGTFGPEDTLNRQQMFCIASRLLEAFQIEYPADTTLVGAYVDGGMVDSWALEPAAQMLESGIVEGADGYLNPLQRLTREQALAILWRVWQRIPVSEDEWTAEDEWFEVAGDIVPGAPTTSGESNGEINRDEQAPDDDELPYIEETYEEKYVRVFGSLDTPKYQSAAEAEEHMVTITVPVWNFNTDHVKVQTSRTLIVHEAIADMVIAIFTEIYNGEEHFPIYAVSGYSWRGDGTSEHNWGLAIDINPDENYYVYHGVPTTGTHWTPGEDPYSIPPDGEVVRAFARYGFTWGGNAWQYTQDYMHFSYFGG